ncbi:CHASE2 domain-containing protein [Aureimonas leprariae]|uniref:CHASE2 domain-containing protein n=1 Tax=Plantimonas leprariae TaxID=2615207 RepID=UPI001386A935|nr:adenylate/guanylate cyclase domain-containing protein [Aureimonas leprariae]
MAFAAAALIALLPPFAETEARIFDFLSTVAPPPVAEGAANDVVIVAIDEPSFSEIGLQWPWPRSLHADLVRALRQAGATAIGLDLVFAEASKPEEDTALASALGPDTVLASDESLIETPQMRQFVRTEPLPELTANGAATGLAALPLDPDGTLRRLPAIGDAFARKVLATVDPESAHRLEGRGDALLQARGPARTYPTVSYYQALDPTAFLPPDTFRNRIVLVGRSLQTAVDADTGSPDTFATPWTIRSGTLLSGVEVHASVVDALREGRAILPLSRSASLLSIAFAAVLAAAIAWRPADRRTVIAGLAFVLLIFVASFALLKGAEVYMRPLAPALAAFGTAAALGTRDLAEERRRRREIVRAFSLYLAPAQVERLVAEPDALKLGGETRRLTVLFSDVRNFTPLAETMKNEPEKLTQLMNRLLTPMSEAVFAEGGTIDKFIGDCLMAFWNAPLADEDHALHAVRAGRAMLKAVEDLNLALKAESADPASVPELSVGVGINTGICVVGNFGSEKRFDYSVLGDAVNYASRLESASKQAGVPLLIGADTAAAVDEALGPVLADRIEVKGRSGRAPVYTIPPGPPIRVDERRRFDAMVERLILGEIIAANDQISDTRLKDLLLAYHDREQVKRG